MDLLKIEYKDWFINQKHLPDKNSQEYNDFYAFHKKLCTEGCLMGGEFINPFLMWHLNFWNTEVDLEPDERGRIAQKYTNPRLRDNEWLVTNEIWRAEQEHKGLCIFGIRRFAKSVLEASYLSWGATFDADSQNVISGLNAQDIKLITDKIDKGLNKLPDAWKWQRIEDNWKNQVTLGVKTKDGTRIPFSYILIRNLDDGNNQEAIAGTKPRKLIIDEGGKGSFLKALQAAIPGFTTPYGWGCSPIITGTGGDMRKFMDAKSLFFDADKYNFLSYPDATKPGRKHGLFIPAKYRMEAKEKSTLAKFLGKEEGTDLDNITILVSNEEKAIQITNDNLTKLKKAGDRNAFLKEKMYYPIEVDDVFLNDDTNIFNIYAAKSQQSKLKEENITGECYVLKASEEGVVLQPTKKQQILDYPKIPGNVDKDAPVVIWEKPMPNPPRGLYVAGVDPYRHDNSAYSESLGAVYILKRMHDIVGEHFQDTIVACYVARPDKKETWNEQARLLIKYYNALTLCENDEMSFIEYMKSKGDAPLYLQSQPEWIKDIVPNTKVNREYGIHRSSDKVIGYLHDCLKQYLDETIAVHKDDKGSVISETLGVHRIRDIALLEEIIQFNEDMNVDRIVAFELAIALANHLNPMIKVSSVESDPRIKALFDPNRNRDMLFGNNPKLFTNSKNKNKLFS